MTTPAHRLLATFLFGALTGMASSAAIFLRSPWWLIAVAVALPGWVWHLRLARDHTHGNAKEADPR